MTDYAGRFAARIADLTRRVSNTERSAQSAYRSVEAGTFEVYDADGNPVAEVGVLTDGSFGVVDLVTTVPSAPTPAIVEPGTDTLSVRWDANYVTDQPTDVTIAYVGVHLNQTPGDPLWEPAVETEDAQITPGGGVVVLPADAGVDTEVRLVTVTAANVWSDVSAAVVAAADYALTVADITTLAASDGIAPTTAPTVTVVPGLGMVFVRWGPVTNPDRVTYKVYVSASAGFLANGTTLLSTIDGTMIGARSLANGTQFTPGTTYYFKVAATDVDGDGPLSAEVSGVPLAVVAADIAASVNTAITTAQTTADGKNQTFYTTTPPTATAIGDLWFDTDDGYKVYRASATGSGSWVPVQDTAIVTAQTTADNVGGVAVGTVAPVPEVAYSWTGVAKRTASTKAISGTVTETNLIPNPSWENAGVGDSWGYYPFEAGLTGAGVYAVATNWAHQGSNSLRMTGTSGAALLYGTGYGYHGTSLLDGTTLYVPGIVAGQVYTFQTEWHMTAMPAGSLMFAQVTWFDAAGASTGAAAASAAQLMTGAGTNGRFVFTTPPAPAGTVIAQIVVYVFFGAASTAYDYSLDMGMLRAASTAIEPFSGDTPDVLSKKLWVDTTGGNNTPKRWDGAAWVVTTDKAATDAATAATAANTLAGTKNRTFIQSSAPSAIVIGDLWIDTGNGNLLKRATAVGTGSWVTVQDAAIATAQSAATTAQTSANGKNTTFYSGTAPTATAIGDLWFDSANGFKAYRASAVGSGSWVSVQDTGIANAVSTANTANTNATAAQTAANGKSKVTYSTSSPGATANQAGDIWFRNVGGVITEQWTGAGGTSWTQVTVDNAVIATLDAAKITTGTLAAARIAADSITATQIAANAITSSELAANAVIAGKIAAGTIVAADIASNTITALQIAADTITAAQIAANAITTSELNAGAVTAAKIAADTITANEIAADAITATELAANAVIAGKINAGAVSTNELAANAVTAAKILAGTITAAQIAANTITSNQVAANTITGNEIDAGYVYAGEIQANQITGGTLTALVQFLVGAGVGGAMSLSPPTIDTTDPANPVNVGGFVVTDPANPGGTPLIQLHPAGSIFSGALTASVLTVLKDFRVNGAGVLSSASSLGLENGVSKPPAPVLAASLPTIAWPVIPSGYAEKGICYDADNNRWLQLLWKESDTHGYYRTISATGVAGTPVLLIRGNDAGETLLTVNGIAWAREHGWLYVWSRYNPTGANPQWRLNEYSTSGGTIYATHATIFDTSPATIYPGVAVDDFDNIIYPSAYIAGTSVRITKEPIGAGTTTYAQILLNTAPTAISMRSMVVSAMDFGVQVLHIADRSGNAWHFTMAPFGTVGSPPTLVLDTSKNFLTESSLAFTGYKDVGVVTAKTIGLNQASLYLKGSHGLVGGDIINVSGVGAPYDGGPYTVLAASAGNIVKYDKVNADLPYVAATGLVTPTVKVLNQLVSSSGNGLLSQYSSYYPTAGEKWWAQYADLGSGVLHTDLSPESPGLSVAARRVVTATLRSVLAGVVNAALYVGYGTTSPGATKYKRSEAVTNRAVMMSTKQVTGLLGTNTITTKAATTTVATITTAVAHGYTTGEVVKVATGDATFDRDATITGTTTTTFTYARTGAAVTAVASGGTVAPANSLGGSPSLLYDTTSYAVASKSRTTTQAVITLTLPAGVTKHVFRVGQVVTVATGELAGAIVFDGPATITAITATTFTYTTATTGTVASTPTVGTVTGVYNFWRGDNVVDLPGLVQMKRINSGKIVGQVLTNAATSVTTAAIPHGCTGIPAIVGTAGPDAFTSPLVTVKVGSVDATNFTLVIQSATAFTGQSRDFSWHAIVPA